MGEQVGLPGTMSNLRAVAKGYGQVVPWARNPVR